MNLIHISTYLILSLTNIWPLLPKFLKSRISGADEGDKLAENAALPGAPLSVIVWRRHARYNKSFPSILSVSNTSTRLCVWIGCVETHPNHTLLKTTFFQCLNYCCCLIFACSTCNLAFTEPVIIIGSRSTRSFPQRSAINLPSQWLVGLPHISSSGYYYYYY